MTQTQMTNPPEGQAKMVSPEKKIKIRALQGIHVASLGRIVNEGEEVEVTPAEVKEFCDKKFTGPYSFDGERSNKNAKRGQYRRAVRLSEIEAARKLAEERGEED